MASVGCYRSWCPQAGLYKCWTCYKLWCNDHLEHDHYGSSNNCYVKTCKRRGSQLCHYCQEWWCSNHLEHEHVMNPICKYASCYKTKVDKHDYCLSHLNVVMKSKS